MKGPDHKASLTGEELKKMIRKIRETEVALGFDKKIVTGSEKVNQKVIRRSIYANHFIKRGDIFSSKNLICLRPDTGISAIKWKKIIGRRALKTLKKMKRLKYKNKVVIVTSSRAEYGLLANLIKLLNRSKNLI